MLKADIRKKYIKKRKTLSDDEVFLLSENIFSHFTNFFQPLSGNKIHLFIPIDKFREIRTEIFIDYCFSNSIRVFVPKVMGKNLISVEIFENTIFSTNDWGISEPVSDLDSGVLDFDFVITPLLYCDSKGNRVGYGKGFYDHFFENIPEKTKKIGVNYFNPDENIDDVRDNDIPLDYLITPTAVLSFLGEK
ncbi:MULTISPECIES: 5-formyltetrahydrofolate cyclo-ligase [Chryseobacterium]|uniref:5-formyltetrahydrofolate cyclo-ligase n=1 Tax=Chryseobacterium taihuense TaxID=1141221 RepID=A0A4U8WBY6_9FLAO|nr:MULTISPECIES: 5-formyltetrahydrofolate cyclo-ligase [Chryseobacterium]QQV02918.1 5-formyltetrahydrofolate cyclo-ligase [Chryseobacterium sp. FDAARGOS 1104]VFB03802.1 5-formyltetrahydrofolate cyclo-ligase family protein [Chryseobacterium taihuense]